MVDTFPSKGQSGDNAMSGNNEDKFRKGLDLMKKGDYQEAISAFSDYLQNHPTNEVKAKVNKGICLHNLQRDIEAEEIFKYVTDQNDNFYYKGLAHYYLKEYLLSLYCYYIASISEPNLDSNLISFRIGTTLFEFYHELRNQNDKLHKNLKMNRHYLDELSRQLTNASKLKISKKTIIEIESIKKCREFKTVLEVIRELKKELDTLNNDVPLRYETIAFYEKWSSRINDEAIKFLRKGIDKNRISPEFFYNRGVALSNLEEYELSVKAFNRAIEESEERYALAYNNKANTLVKIGKYEDAIEAYTEAIKISNNKYSIAYNDRGQVYFNLKNYKKALKDFNKSIELNSSNYKAWTNKGAVFFYQKEYGKAKEAFEKALDLNPDYALANVYLAKLLFYLGNTTLASETINKALDLDVRNADAWRLKGQLLLEDNYEEAIKSFDNAVQYSKGDVSLVLWKAYARYLKVLNPESQASSSSNQEEKPKFPLFSELKKRINSLLSKSKNSQSSNESPDKKEGEGSEVKNEYYSIIRELEMYSSISCERKDINKHIILKKWDDFSFWVRKNVELLFLPIIRYFLIDHTLFSITARASDFNENDFKCTNNDKNNVNPKNEVPNTANGNRDNDDLNNTPNSNFNLFYISLIIASVLVPISIVTVLTYLTLVNLIPITAVFVPLIGKLLIIVIFLVFLFIILNAIVHLKTDLQSINSALEKYETYNVNSYVLCLLGCLYYKVGDYFEAKNKLEECIKYGSKDVKKSATQLLDHISANYIRSPWWTWWLSSPTYRWTKRIIFTSSSFGFIVLLLFHPFIYPILFKFIYLNQFKDFFTEANVTSNMTNNTTTYTDTNSSAVISGNITGNVSGNDTGMAPNSSITITENLNETVAESFKSIQYDNSALIKSNEIFMNFDPSTVNNILYYVLVSIPIFILFSPHISKLTFKTTPVEIEMKSPKDFEFILHPCLMDDVVRRIDDIPG